MSGKLCLTAAAIPDSWNVRVCNEDVEVNLGGRNYAQDTQQSIPGDLWLQTDVLLKGVTAKAGCNFAWILCCLFKNKVSQVFDMNCVCVKKCEKNHGGTIAPSRQLFSQKFWVKSESTPVFLSKNLSLERRIATNLNSRQKYAFRTNIEFSRKCMYLQLKPI